MPSYLERYLAGDMAAVWSDLVALGVRLRAPEHLEDAQRVAGETMRRVRRNVEVVRERLERLGYAFLAPDRAYVAPPVETAEMLAEIERLRGPIPLSLRAFYERVGAVDFRQARPQHGGARASASVTEGLGEEDPLVVAPVDDLLSAARASASTASKRMTFTFAPDEFHKANQSGGDNYHLWLPDANADFAIEGMYDINEYFVAYLRRTFAMGGFRGRLEPLPDDESQARKASPRHALIGDLSDGLTPL